MINQQGQNRNPEELPLSTAHHSLPSLPSSRADTHRPWTCSCSAAAEIRHQPIKKYSSDADKRRRTRALLGDAAGSYQRYLQPGGNVYRSAPTVRLFRRPLRSLARVRHRLEAETGSHRLSRFNAACRCDLHQHRRYLMHGGRNRRQSNGQFQRSPYPTCCAVGYVSRQQPRTQECELLS